MARLVLVGLPGVGKSTIGERVGRELGVAFVDLDEEIARAVGVSAGEYLRLHGEAEFRRVEFEQLRSVVASDVVLGPGGGVVTTPEARALLRDERVVVWLQAPVEALLARIGSTDRPLLEGDANDRLQRLDRERTGFYAELATDTIDASRGIDDVVRDVMACVTT